MNTTVAIVGMNHLPDGERIVNSLMEGDTLLLERDPGNRFDSNAIKVWARGHHVGFIKAPHARDLAPFIDAHGTKASESDGVAITAKFHWSSNKWPMAVVDVALAGDNNNADPGTADIEI